MSDSLGEFLVGIGWEPNKAGQVQFESAIVSATLKAKLLAEGLEALARKVLDSVSDIATNFDRLYFQAQRTNTAASAVQDFVTVMKQAGVSASAAESSIANMTDKLRAGQIAITDINRMGWGLNPITKRLELQEKYLTNMANMSDAQRVAGANYVGMDLEVARQEQRLGASLLEQTEKLKSFRKALGYDPEQAQADGNKLASIWREADSRLGAIKDKIGSGLGVAMIEPLKRLDDFLLANAEPIGNAIDAIMKAVLEMTAQWSKDLDEWIKDPKALQNFRDNMHEVSTDIAAMALSFHGFIDDFKWMLSVGSDIVDILNHLTGQKESGHGGDKAFGSGVDKRRDTEAPKPPSMWRSIKDGARRLLGMPTSWDAPAALGSTRGDHVSQSGPSGRTGNANFTKDNADAVRAAAVELGTTPEDLATVIGYETAGTYSPSIVGGTGNRYQGLIQFGGPEREKYGASGSQTFPDQMKSVVRYLKDRGFKPGMSLTDLYSTINAGSPGHPDRSDGHGTVASHVSDMQGATAARARAFLAAGGAPTTSNDYGNLRLTGDAASAGASNSGIIALAHHVQDTEDTTQFHAFHDDYHKTNNPRSMHNQGLAFDVSTKSGNYEASRGRTREHLKGLGLVEGDLGGRGGDFAIEEGTTNHMHVQFNSAASAKKYLELTQSATQAPAQYSELMHAVKSWGTGGALASSLTGGAAPTLGGAAPAAATKIHAPMTTEINVTGGSGDPTAALHMIAAHAPLTAANGMRNNHGATY